jgi:hypothetical protein
MFSDQCAAMPQTGAGGGSWSLGCAGVVIQAESCPQPLAVREAIHGDR